MQLKQLVKYKNSRKPIRNDANPRIDITYLKNVTWLGNLSFKKNIEKQNLINNSYSARLFEMIGSFVNSPFFNQVSMLLLLSIMSSMMPEVLANPSAYFFVDEDNTTYGLYSSGLVDYSDVFVALNNHTCYTNTTTHALDTRTVIKNYYDRSASALPMYEATLACEKDKMPLQKVVQCVSNLVEAAHNAAAKNALSPVQITLLITGLLAICFFSGAATYCCIYKRNFFSKSRSTPANLEEGFSEPFLENSNRK